MTGTLLFLGLGMHTFFYAEFNKPIKLKRDQDSIAVFTYEPDSTPLLIKTGLSAVSEDKKAPPIPAFPILKRKSKS